MELLINKIMRSGFLPDSAPSADALAGEADQRLFSAVMSDPNHVLRQHGCLYKLSVDYAFALS